jgi:flavodoxin
VGVDRNKTKQTSARRTLLVYFSRTGYTRKIAEEIAGRCGADLEAIEDVRARTGIIGYLRSAREAYKKLPIEIRPAVKNPADYDLVILGTPVWASNVSSPMRTYLTSHGRELKQVAVYCTQRGSGAEKVLSDMAELCGRKPVASLVLNDGEIKRRSHAAKLDGFLVALALPKAA